MSTLIGPHDGRELELMLAGDKRLALFFEFEPAAAFAPHVAAGTIIRFEWTSYFDDALQSAHSVAETEEGTAPVIYHLPGGESERDQLMAAIIATNDRDSDGWEDAERMVGRLLGYSPDAIEAYIEAVR